MTVADDMHNRGIGTLLLEHLMSLARGQGIRTFMAETLTENTLMLQAFANAGLRAHDFAGQRRQPHSSLPPARNRVRDDLTDCTSARPRFAAGLSRPGPFLARRGPGRVKALAVPQDVRSCREVFDAAHQFVAVAFIQRPGLEAVGKVDSLRA